MRASKLCLTLALVGGAGFLAGTVFSQDPGAAPMDPAQIAEMMKLAEPGPEHAELAKHAGHFDMDISMWMMPGAPVMKAKSVSESKLVLGGRWLQNESHGEFMGSPVDTLGFLGFDRRTGEYVTVGMDTMGTYFVTASGKKEADGIIRMHGVDVSPMDRQVYTFEFEFPSDDQQITRLFFSEMAGQKFDPPFKLMEFTATRRD